MSIIFCSPQITMEDKTISNEFYLECKNMLDKHICGVKYIDSQSLLNHLAAGEINQDDVVVFFNSDTGNYNKPLLRVLEKCEQSQCRVWPIAMYGTPLCRKPPEPALAKQSFDVASRLENRNSNSINAIAQLLVRKLISQVLSPLYHDEVLYFISHKRSDGEALASKLADQLKLLTRERNVYRDVVNVQVGDEAQADIDKNLRESDVLIFLQTEEARASKYIIKELNYALIYDIPILWIQIDNADYKKLEIRPGEQPILKYRSADFFNDTLLTHIVDEVERNCFELIMNCSNQVYSYLELLDDLNKENKIVLKQNEDKILAYNLQYSQKVKDRYSDGIIKHYIQCFGRNPKEKDLLEFAKNMKGNRKIYNNCNHAFLLSKHGYINKNHCDKKIIAENFEDYIANLQNVSGEKVPRLDKRIIISGAFPDCDEIYNNSLTEAVMIYARYIIRSGYTLVFGAHPTFQNAIFEIGKLYSDDVKYSIEMHMDKKYLAYYDEQELNENCKLILSDGLQEMRMRMIATEAAEMMICLGGKIKDDKTEQGVDIEINMARRSKLPVALVGTVGGRSSEYALEMIQEGGWDNLNPWGTEFNESLFYNLNHRVMINRLLNTISQKPNQ